MSSEFVHFIKDAQTGEITEVPFTEEEIEAVLNAPPPPVPVPASISDRQFYQQLATEGICTPAHALEAVKTGFIPPALQAILDAVTDPAEHFGLEMLLSGATVFERAHPATTAVGYAFDWTDEQIDAFFIAAAQL